MATATKATRVRYTVRPLRWRDADWFNVRGPNADIVVHERSVAEHIRARLVVGLSVLGCANCREEFFCPTHRGQAGHCGDECVPDRIAEILKDMPKARRERAIRKLTREWPETELVYA